MGSSVRDRSRWFVPVAGTRALSLALLFLHLALAPLPVAAQRAAQLPLAEEHMLVVEVDLSTAQNLERLGQKGFTCPGRKACRLELSAAQLDALQEAGFQVTVLQRAIKVTPQPPSAWEGGVEPHVHGLNGTNVPIPDATDGTPGYATSPLTVSGAPGQGKVTKVRYKLRVVHNHPGDLALHLNHMGSPNAITVWNRLGGSTDGGLDDDPENDKDIELDRLNYTQFDGVPANGDWRLEAVDRSPDDVGWIDYLELWVYYCVPPASPLLAVPPDGDHICDVLAFFDWSDVGGATGYRIQVDNNSDFSSPEVDATPTASEYRHMDSLAAGQYQWRVRSCDSCGCSNWSLPGHFVVDDVPPAPTLTAPANSSRTCDTTPFLDWSTVSGATEYRLQVDDSASFSSPVVDTLVSISNREVGPLAPGTYHWRVRAHNDCGHSLWSNAWSFVIDTAPAAPTLLAPANGSHTSDATPAFDWSDVSGAMTYTWELDEHPAFPASIARTVSTSAYTLDSPLSTGTYYWRVKVETACGVSPWSQYWDFTVDASTNRPPTNGTITPNSGGAPAGQIVYFTSSWSDPDGQADLKACRLHIGRWAAPKSLIGNAVVLYQARTNKLLIRNDRGTRWWGGRPVGSDNVIQNSQVKVYCKRTTVTRAANTITVRWALEFKPAFKGRAKMHLKARDLGGLTSALQQKGAWTVQ